MVPIRLAWRRPTDGVEMIEGTAADDGAIFRAQSERMDDVTYDIVNLEDPMIVRFLNSAKNNETVATFFSRFGMLTREEMTPLSEVRWVVTQFMLGLVHAQKADAAHHLNNINYFLKDTVLRPSFEHAGKSSKLVFHPNSLVSLMAMEAAFAHEVGAVSSSCAHCGKIYLTGPLTGRRSHSVYCSDRCRVAAMRARNAEKG